MEPTKMTTGLLSTDMSETKREALSRVRLLSLPIPQKENRPQKQIQPASMKFLSISTMITKVTPSTWSVKGKRKKSQRNLTQKIALPQEGSKSISGRPQKSRTGVPSFGGWQPWLSVSFITSGYATFGKASGQKKKKNGKRNKKFSTIALEEG